MMRTYQDEQQDPCCFPKRVLRARNLLVRTLDIMAKDRPLRPRPLTLRFLSGPVHALQKKHSQALWQYFRVVLIHLLALILLRLFLVYIMYYSMKLALTQPEC